MEAGECQLASNDPKLRDEMASLVETAAGSAAAARVALEAARLNDEGILKRAERLANLAELFDAGADCSAR